MENLNQKTLKIIAGVIIFFIVAIVIFLGVTAEKPLEEEEGIAEIMNNNEKVVHHSGDIYCYTRILKENRWVNVLLKLPIDFNSTTPRMIVQEFSTNVKDVELNFENNKLFYTPDVNTYIYNITGNRIDRFCEGELQFLYAPNSYVTLCDGNLYKGDYYTQTYLTKKIKKLTEGSFNKFDEDENRVYYSTQAGSNTIVVALDKSTLNIILIDNFETKKQQLEDVLVTDNYIYELIRDGDGLFVKKVSNKLKNENERIEYEILPIENAEYIEFIDSMYSREIEPLNNNSASIGDDLYFYICDVEEDVDADMTEYIIVSKAVYKYDEAQNKVDAYNDDAFNELWLDNYSLVLNDSNVELYHKNKFITSIETDITENVTLGMNSVNVIGDYLYYEFQISNGNNRDIVLARTLKTGGESQRINLKE